MKILWELIYNILWAYGIVFAILFLLSYLTTHEIEKAFKIVLQMVELEFSKLSGFISAGITIIFLIIFLISESSSFYLKLKGFQADGYEIVYFIGAVLVALANFGLMYGTRPKNGN